MRIAVLAAAAVLLLSTAAAVRGAAGTLHRPQAPEMKTFRRPAEPTEGTWTMELRDDGRMQLALRFGTSSWGHPVDRAELAGLADAQVNAPVSTPVAFRIDREAGRFDLEGAFREGRGSGHVRFHPDRAFAATLREMGVRDGEAAEDRDLMMMALGGTSRATLRELAGLGVRPETVEEVVELGLFDITPAYVREVRGLWPEGTERVEALVEMRIHRVSAAFVRELEGVGFRGLSREEVMRMGIHGVTPEYVREMREAGFRDLTPEALVRMRIHGIGAEQGRGARRRARG